MTTTETKDGKQPTCCPDINGMPCNCEEMFAMMRQRFGNRKTAKDGEAAMSDCAQTMQTMMGMCRGEKNTS